ncbi:MAG: ImmA/IrrE family metallo-endopeptidase [Planctomycetota bacterium]|jgi:Zn-dependent peptidase ImmA (M78 family)
MRSDQDIEREANYFAMCLLMPEDWLHHELAGQPPFDIESDERIAELAKHYGVSVQLMMMRLHQLGYLGE